METQGWIKDLASPFMLGTIALIAFLSLRTQYLAKTTRDLCDKLLESPTSAARAKHLGMWQSSLSLQLLDFSIRYRDASNALSIAIGAVTCFGDMVGIGTLLQRKDFTWDFRQAGPTAMLIIGGILATMATIVSIRENHRGRHSLFTHLATTLVGAGFDQHDWALLSTLHRFGRLFEGVIDNETQGRFIQLQESFAKPAKLVEPVHSTPDLPAATPAQPPVNPLLH